MDIRKIIEEQFGEVRTVGNQYLVKECPFCGKKYKFYIGQENLKYYCHYAGCSANSKDEFRSDLQEYLISKGVLEKKIEVINAPTEKEIKITVDNYKKYFTDLDKTYLKYLASRGISEETAKSSNVLLDNLENRGLAFPLRRKKDDGKFKIVGVKYRTVKKDLKSMPGSEMVLLGWETIPDNEKTVVITEGEICWLTLRQLGFNNVCSMPNGAGNTNWIEKHWEWLDSKKSIVLAYDNDDAGRVALEKAVDKLGIAKVKMIDLQDVNDINDYFMKYGATDTIEMIENHKDIPVKEIIDNRDIPWQLQVDDCSFGDKNLDFALDGHRFGEVTLWTGFSGTGKSSLMCNMIANLINQDQSVFLYTGELTKGKAKNWIGTIVSGYEGIEEQVSKYSGEKTHYIKNGEWKEKIEKFLDKRFYLLDKGRTTPGDLINFMEIALKRNGCRTFIIDNMMTIKTDGNINEAQTDLVWDLHEFAVKYKVHIHLVAHPKKTDRTSLKDVDMYDVSGSANIVNSVDNVIFLKRVSESDLEDFQKLSEKYDSYKTIYKIISESSVALKVCKARENGRAGIIVGYNYDQPTRRFLCNDGYIRDKYNLNKQKVEIDMDYIPF
jgi:twinkle protein